MRILVALAVLAMSTSASAVTISGLYNTGAGYPLGTNGVDSNWTLFGGPAYVSGTNGVFPVGTNWIADTENSRWITPTANAGDSLDPVADDIYAYSLNFSLAGFDPNTATFTGRFAADNDITGMTLNGTSIALGGGGFTTWSLFGSAGGTFNAGNNVLTVFVNNIGQDSGNPSGLRIEFLSSDVTALPGGAIPEPATWAMLIAGFGLVGAAARRRRNAAVSA